MTTNYYCRNFESTLNTVHNKGITTKSALMENSDLCTELWLTTKAYIDHYVLLSKTSRNSKGETTLGNSAKIAELSKHAVCDREDIENDCLVKIMDKLDLILAKPIAVQQYYSYKIINNVVNQACRNFLPPDNYIIVSLQDTVGNNTSELEESYTYESVVGDYNTPETILIEKENLTCLTNLYKEMKIKEESKKHLDFIKETKLVADKPAEMFAYITKKAEIKNNKVTNMLLERGLDITFDYVINVSKKIYHLNKDETDNFYKIFSVIKAEDLKLHTNDPFKVGDQISKLRNRAKNKIK